MTYPTIAKGSKIGIHCTQGIGTGIDRLREMVSKGVICPVFKVVDNLGAILEAKSVGSNGTIFIYRFVNPDDSAQGIENPDYDYVGAVNRTFALLHDRFRSPAEIALLSDPNFYVEILNEADPPGVTGYANFGKLCRMMAERGTAERIKLVLPAYNSGTPEWDEFVAFTDSGVFQAMIAGQHLLSIHEGPFGVTDPIITYGPIPGAPIVPGAGVWTLRYRNWVYHLKQKNISIPRIVVSEFYAGGGHGWEDGAENGAQMAARMATADTEWRKDIEIIGVLPFTLGGADNWANSNYDFAYGDIINYMVNVKDLPNITNPPPPPITNNLYETTAALNVREYAWTDSLKTPKVVRVLNNGEKVIVYWQLKHIDPTKADWACISPNRNEWVSMYYLRKV